MMKIGFLARPRWLLLTWCMAWLFVGLSAIDALAAGPALKLHVSTTDYILPGEGLQQIAYVENAGDATANGTITLSDVAGMGLGVQAAEYAGDSAEQAVPPAGEAQCEVVGKTVTCTFPGPLPPGAMMAFRITLNAEAESGTVTNTVTAAGGGTVGVATDQREIAVGPHGPFGFRDAAAELVNRDGSTASQAGSDPFEFTTRLDFNTFTSELLGVGITAGVGHIKDVTAHLPVGLVGNSTSLPTCTTGQLLEKPVKPGEVFGSALPNCPLDSQIGVAIVHVSTSIVMVPLYNMVAPPGVATELGFEVYGVAVPLEARLRPDDNGIDIVSRDISTTLPIPGVEVTVWGTPSDPRHDPYRGMCLVGAGWSGSTGESCPAPAGDAKAFLRLPTSCSNSPLRFGASADSYEQPDVFSNISFTSPAMSGCERVPFAPSIGVFPTGTAANSPTGLSVRLSSPQSSNPAGLAEADLKKAVVELPEGMALNPSAADGLQACTDAQLRVGLSGPAECPDGSKIGTVLLHTPLLAEPIEGTVYVLSQNSSDPESGEMFRIGMELRNDPRGIDIKVAGHISADKATGRLTTTFDDNPQLPFSDITLSFKAGARAPLVTPASCLPQTTEADLYSWAQPDAAVRRSNSFSLTSGPEGTPCMSQEPFSPGFDAGVKSVQAGGFTPFLTTFSRKDADQSLQRVSVRMPPGLLGSLVGLPLCPEAPANAGNCSPASEIGSVTAGAGAGPTPFYVTGGHVYMTGPYEGAPFGLSVVVPAKAGPFDLGTVVVRAKVEVDPHTTQLTITTDPLPQIVGGVPVNLRLVNVTIDRPNFTYNPTDCDPLSVWGSMAGGQDAVANVVERFQVTNCGALRFKPSFKVSTNGKTSRAKGASLTARLVYPKAPLGGQANIAKVKVSLPKQLPSRLTTLQKACPSETFDANPAACPVASRIGSATATTPVLPVPLTGPVYFVSHGGEAFPDLVVVLQGYGVTVDLVGTTFISKAGITSTTFKQVPDVPVGTFELKLPQGRYSALAANGDLCKGKLAMPTAFLAQDGVTIHQTTSITPTNCPRRSSHRVSHKRKRGKKR
jgi:hypothetical protein